MKESMNKLSEEETIEDFITNHEKTISYRRKNDVLTISGNGHITEFDIQHFAPEIIGDYRSCPWFFPQFEVDDDGVWKEDYIRKIIIEDGITGIEEHAFDRMFAKVHVESGARNKDDIIYYIGCQEITLPRTLKYIGFNAVNIPSSNLIVKLSTDYENKSIQESLLEAISRLPPPDSGSCGRDTRFQYANKTLTFSGTGSACYKLLNFGSVETVIVEEGITHIDAILPASVVTLSLPDSLKEFPYDCIQGCTQLREIRIGTSGKWIKVDE